VRRKTAILKEEMAIRTVSKKPSPKFVTASSAKKSGGSKNALHAMAAVMVLGALSFGIYQSVHSSLFNLKLVEVETFSDGYPLTRDEVVKLAKVPLNRYTLFNVDLKPIEERLMKDPWVKGVVIGKQFPNTLSLKVVERKPVALLSESKGRVFYLEEDGTAFEDQSMVYPKDLPILTGFSADNIYLLKKVNQFVATWFSPEKMPGVKLSSVSYDEKLGLRAMVSYPLKNQKQMRTVLELGLNIEEATLIPQDRLLKVLGYLGRRSMQASKIWLGDGKKIVVKMARGT
jgi:cell division septal protein FtsQ